MAGRCQLCDGRIINGRCSECGMDYTRMKNRYHLNQDCDDYDPNAKRLNAAFEKSLQGAEEKRAAGKVGKQPAQRTRIFKGTNEDDLVKKINAQAAEARKRQQNIKKPGTKKPKGKSGSGMLVGIIIFIVMVIYAMAGIYDDSDDDYSYVVESSDVSETGSAVSWADESETPASFATDGDSCSMSMLPGMYMVGVDIPAGVYELTNNDESNSVYVYVTAKLDDSLGQYYIEASDTVTGVYLYDGDRLTIPQQSSVDMHTDNGQVDSMHAYEDGDGEAAYLSTESVGNGSDHPTYTVGEAIEPGRYRVTYEPGAHGSDASAFATCILTDAGGDSYEISLTFSEDGDESFQVILTEGDTIEIQEFEAIDGTLDFEPVDVDGSYM